MASSILEPIPLGLFYLPAFWTQAVLKNPHVLRVRSGFARFVRVNWLRQ